MAVSSSATITISDGEHECHYDLMAVLYGAAEHAYQYSIDACDGAVQQRMLKTRIGHTILLDDSDSSKSIVITDSGGNKITWDAANSKIEIVSQGDLKVSATGTLKLEGQAVELSASGGNVTIKGTQIKLN